MNRLSHSTSRTIPVFNIKFSFDYSSLIGITTQRASIEMRHFGLNPIRPTLYNYTSSIYVEMENWVLEVLHILLEGIFFNLKTERKKQPLILSCDF
jgi:hypothetical protein